MGIVGGKIFFTGKMKVVSFKGASSEVVLYSTDI